MEDIRLKEEAFLRIKQDYVRRGWNPDIVDHKTSWIRIFLYTRGISDQGPNRVPCDLIYHTYMNSVQDSRKMHRREFTRFIKLFLTSYNSSKVLVFRIDATKIGLPADYSVYRDPRFTYKKVPNKPKYHGVRHSGFGEWIAELRFEGKDWLIGYFSKPGGAAMAYDAMVKYFKFDYPLNNLKIPKKDKRYEEAQQTIRDLKILLNTRSVGKRYRQKRALAEPKRSKTGSES